ncbi:YfcC family protein [Trueperella sp.]|uniref:YfcC family protein n=1 Tax=Trueperella sp. TaxID=2699835 RepID=UPI00262AEF4D|nr:YfcC family protein [Trueperella sp.]
MSNVKQDQTPQVGAPKRKFRLRVPSAFTVLFVLTIIAALATWAIPAGQYAKLSYDADSSSLVLTPPKGDPQSLPAEQESLEDLGVDLDITQFTSGSLNKPISVPGSYERLEQNPAGFTDVPSAMVRGTIEAVDVMVFIFVLGGLIGVVRKTGAFESGLVALTKRTKGHEFALIFFVAVFMLAGGSLCGLEEEAVAFYPILVPIFLALGYDSIVSVGAIFLAGSMGTTFSTVNPFSSVIASNAAGIQFTEGIWWRFSGLIVGGVVVVFYLHWYSKKVKDNPAFSYTWEDHADFTKRWAMNSSMDDIKDFNWEKKIILVLFVSAFVIMVWGVMAAGWWFPQMAAAFLVIAIIIMLIAALGREKLSESALVDAFSEGASSLVAVSLIIGLARGINLVMNEGLISDTILNSLTTMVSGMSGPLFIIMLMLVFFILGFVVPSSSGLAVLAMPIFAPLADAVGMPRWIIVMAYQYGQYAMLFLAPTGLVMATLQMLNMKYSHWLRFVWPMVLFVLGFGGVLCATAVIVSG